MRQAARGQTQRLTALSLFVRSASAVSRCRAVCAPALLPAPKRLRVRGHVLPCEAEVSEGLGTIGIEGDLDHLQIADRPDRCG